MAIQIDVVCVDERDPNSPRREVYAKEQILVGRGDENDLILDHPSMSGAHMRLRVEKNGGAPKFFVTDLQSTNGTFVGNRQAPPQVEVLLTERERLMVGGYVLRLQYVTDEVAEADSSEKSEEPPVKSRAASVGKTGVFEIPGRAGLLSDLAENEESQAREPSIAELAKSVSVDPSRRPTVDSRPGAAATFLVRDADIDIDFVATQLFSIKGRVLHNSVPLMGVSISDPELGSRMTDAAGQYVFENVPDGAAYNLKLSKEGYSLTPAELSGKVHAGDAEVSASALRFASIRGAVIHRGQPLSGVIIDGGELGRVTTDDSGKYEFTNVLEGGEYTLTAYKDGFIFGTIKKSAA